MTLTFAAGALVASLGWFVFFTISIMRFSLQVYDGIEGHVKKARLIVDTAKVHMDSEYGRTLLNDLDATLNQLLPEEDV